jgi:CheY-like chemotaxis protein
VNEDAGAIPQGRAWLLLVEDSDTDAGLFVEGLGEMADPPHVHRIADSQAAWKEVQRILQRPRTGWPLMMVLDIGLPGQSGLELLERMRSSAAAADWPVVILTSSLSEVDVQRARAAQASGYFAKPMTLEGYIQLADHMRSRWLARPAGGA